MPFRALPLQYQSLLFLLDSCNSLQKALQIQAQIFLHGLHHHRLPLSKLISFFALSSSSSLRHSLLHLPLLSHPNIFICNTLIRAFSPSLSLSFSLYKTILSDRRPSPNRFTFTFLTLSCSRFPDPRPGLQLHSHAIKRGFGSDPHVANSLVRFYSRFRRPSLARQLFDALAHPDVVAFNVMIRGYYKSGCPRDGLSLFKQMAGSGVEPDRFTLAALLPICAAVGDLNAGKAVHALTLKTDGDRLEGRVVDMYSKFGMMNTAERVFGAIACRSVGMWSCMVSGYAKCGDVETARRYFDEMPKKDLIAWTSMIGGYSRMGRCREALELYKEMEKEGIKPDEVTLVAVLSACAKLGDLEFGKRLHRYAEDGLLGHTNAILSAALMDMYAKCGCLGTALRIFNRVDKESKTTSLFNSMISGLAQHGLGEGAIAVFREMEASGLRPDEITFVGVLGACSRSGLLEEGKELFDLMVKKYGIIPEIEHYGCMVDLFGRGGCLDVAYDFIEKMPIRPNFVIWSTLLHACRVRGNFKIGNIARESLLRLDLSSKGRNFHLSELFSDQRNPEDSRKVTSSEVRNFCLSELFSNQRNPEDSKKVTSSKLFYLSELFSNQRNPEDSKKVASSEGRNFHLSELFSNQRNPESKKVTSSEGRNFHLSELFSNQRNSEDRRKVMSSEGRDFHLSELFSNQRNSEDSRKVTSSEGRNFHLSELFSNQMIPEDSKKVTSSEGRNFHLSELFSNQRNPEDSKKVTSSEGRNFQLSELFSNQRIPEDSKKVTSSEGRNFQLSELFSNQTKRENGKKVKSSKGRNFHLSELFSNQTKRENGKKVKSSKGRNFQLSELFSNQRIPEDSKKVTSSEGRNFHSSELFSNQRNPEDSRKVTSSEGINFHLSELFSNQRKRENGKKVKRMRITNMFRKQRN